MTNWLSPWIEWHITPAKYTANELLVHRGIDAIVTHAGGIEPLRTAIHADPQVHARIFKFCASRLDLQTKIKGKFLTWVWSRGAGA